VSTALFNRQLFALTTSFRGATSALIYSKSLVKEAGYNELAAVTLMSTDIDRMTMSFTMSMDMWARFIEVAIGVWLLWRQIGAIAIAPIIVTLICFMVQSWSSSYMGARQARYQATTFC
jgi:ATP-binding cassette subfamily C (CFTR/MRP) protein 1